MHNQTFHNEGAVGGPGFKILREGWRGLKFVALRRPLFKMSLPTEGVELAQPIWLCPWLSSSCHTPGHCQYTGVARAFLVGWVGPPRRPDWGRKWGKIEKENNRRMRKNERIFLSCPPEVESLAAVLPTRGWASGCAPANTEQLVKRKTSYKRGHTVYIMLSIPPSILEIKYYFKQPLRNPIL